jgi:hypothetical protein
MSENTIGKEEFLIYIGDFQGTFYTPQKSALDTTQIIEFKQLPHDVRLIEGNLNDTEELTEFNRDAFVNKESLSLKNASNIKIYKKGLENENRIPDLFTFNELLIIKPEVDYSWEIEKKTYGKIKGRAIGIYKKSDFSKKEPLPPNPPNPPDGNISGGSGVGTRWTGPTLPPSPPTPPEPKGSGLLSFSGLNFTYGQCLLWLLAILAFILLVNWLFTWCNSGSPMPWTAENCCDKIEIIEEKVKILEEKQKRLKREMEVIDNENEIDRRRRRENGRTGVLTISLIWNTLDDVDLHVNTPSGEEIFFNKLNSSDGGELDVDMNAGIGTSEDPIENIRWLSNPPLGKYKVSAVFFGKNTNNVKVPFTVEISYRGNSQQFSGMLNYVGERILVHELNINQ